MFCKGGGNGRISFPPDDSRQRCLKGMLRPFLVPSLFIVSTITREMRRSRVSFEILSRPLPHENAYQVRREMQLTLHYPLLARAREEARRARPPTRIRVLLHFLKLEVSGGLVIQRL